MNQIADLIDRMAVIPAKEKKTNQLGVMTAFRDKLMSAADDLHAMRALTAALRSIDGADFADKANQSLEGASTAALKFRERMVAGRAFDNERADATLTAINEKLGLASANVGKGWKALIDDQRRRFSPLAEAAERAALPGAAGLNAAIDALANWRDNPPATPQAAEAYIQNAASIPAAIAGLGLEGRAGEFLIAASKGDAKAKDLQEPGVLAFLDANPAIWSMLKVRI